MYTPAFPHLLANICYISEIWVSRHVKFLIYLSHHWSHKIGIFSYSSDIKEIEFGEILIQNLRAMSNVLIKFYKCDILVHSQAGVLKLNTRQLETPGVNHYCLMAIVYGRCK